MSSTRVTSSRLLIGLSLGVVSFGLLCKILLFRAFDYVSADLYSFLDMSWSWHYSGRLLYENAYGNHAAIHNFYIMLVFSPLTMAFGAHGLFIGLGALNALAAVRVAASPSLGVPARVGVLAGALSPLAFFVFDDVAYGFHPELCYPPLAILLALDLRERRFRRALLPALAMLLVKEDGAIVLGSVLVAFFAEWLWRIRKGSPGELKRATFVAAGTLAAVAFAFFGGLALLWAMGRGTAGQETGSGRLSRSLEMVNRTVSGRGRADRLEVRSRSLTDGLVVYVVLGSLVLFPLGRRWGRGLALAAVAMPAILATLVASGGVYEFAMMVWAPRLALVLATASACLVFAEPTPDDSPRDAGPLLGLLIAVAWGLEIVVLHRSGYLLQERVNVVAIARGESYRIAGVPEVELRFGRCIAERLPRAMPVTVPTVLLPLFHHQSIVFAGLEDHALRPASILLRPTSSPPSSGGRLCSGPRAGDLVLESECGLLPTLANCGWRAIQASPSTR